MKSAIKGFLHRLGYDFVRHVEMPERPPDLMKLVVEARIARGLPVRFVQIGANDGVWNDPIRNLVVRHSLPGLLVEPLPDVFGRLQANYAGQPGISFEQSAVGTVDGEATLYRVRPEPNLPAWLQGIASFDREHLSSRKFGIPHLESYVDPVRVPVLTITSLLKKHRMDGIDLLQIDTEGHDCPIVESAIRAGLRPAIINYECIHTPPAVRAACKRLLADHGYTFIDVGRDTLAILDDEPAAGASSS